MRAQWCREHIDETAKNCCLGIDVISDVKKAAEFCLEHPDLSDCSTRTIMALIRFPEDLVRERAISSIEKSLESGRHPVTGKKIKNKRLTEKDVRNVIDRALKEVRIEHTGETSDKDSPTPVGSVETQEPAATTPEVPQPLQPVLPDSTRRFVKSLPDQIQRIIKKILEEDTESRYRGNPKDLIIALIEKSGSE